VHEGVHIDASPFAVKPNRFYRRVETDFVTELEAVGKRFLRAINAYGYTIDFMGLHSGTICLTRGPVYFYRRIFQPGYPRATLESHVDLMGYLCREFVKRKRRDQADYTTPDSCCYGYQIGVSQWFVLTDFLGF
jgi:hypothetical protein